LGLTTAQAAGIGAGIIAVIVIAAVATVIFLGVGGKKGYDYWKARNKGMGSVLNNPLYEEKASAQGTNPLYEEGGSELKLGTGSPEP